MAHGEILHRMESNVTMRKRNYNSKFDNGEIFEIYSTLHTMFGDNIQLNEQVLEIIYLKSSIPEDNNLLFRNIQCRMTAICCVKLFCA